MREFIVSIAVSFIAIGAGANEIGFTIIPGDRQNVTFHSKATIESFDGTTSDITGTISIDPDLPDSVTASFNVDLTTLDTGIGLRNKHMRKNHLHTDQYPEATFTLTSTKGPVQLIDGSEVSFIAIGDFYIHGVTRQIEVPVTVTWYLNSSETPLRSVSQSLHITGEFFVTLADHDIPRPQFLIMKLAETQRVTLDLWAKAGE